MEISQGPCPARTSVAYGFHIRVSCLPLRGHHPFQVTLMSPPLPVNSVGTMPESWSLQHHGPCQYQFYQKCQPSPNTRACLAQALVRMETQGGTR